ncbi:helix-turn-helix domain-containing protein [Streptococcus infantarius]|uniref:helix-turn-helix domain-containing protein n=1 Tax=Streptococcus infantarius TaxID=102684 RepID=UPI0022E34434|nr:helix-turn-helix transcriptional regulator [Streptococcus infantarius]
MELERRLAELRKEKNISQEEIAEKLYVSRQTISNWERGKTYPDINSLLLMANYFDVSLDHLIKGDVDTMKHQVDQSQFKKWLIFGGIFWFIFSVVFGTRYLIVKNRELQTYAYILNFFNPEKKVKINFFREVWFVFSLLTVTWLIFFVGVVVSTLVFY